jgi:ATP-dependent Clp protease ATP-binding subunit ClpA
MSPLPLNSLTPRMRRCLIAAGTFAEQAEQAYVGTEHVLMALADDPDGVAGQVLIDLGVRDAVVEALALLITSYGPTPDGVRPFDPGDEVSVFFDPATERNHPLRIQA